MQKLRAILGGFSPIAMTALLFLLVLCAVSVVRVMSMLQPQVAPIVAVADTDTRVEPSDEQTPEWQQQALLLGLSDDTDAVAATTTDHLAMIGPMVMGEILGSYSAIREKGDYSKDDLRNAANKIAQYVKAAVSYDAYTNTDFKTVDDSSAERARLYRDELQRAIAPLATIPGAEYEIYARYDQTSDPKYLQQLKDAAELYRTSANDAAALTIPRDAVNFHRDTLNALLAFASVLDGLAGHADDPYASMALLRTYNEKEQDIYDSYNRLREYYASKEI